MFEEVFTETANTTLIDRNLDNFLPLKSLGGQQQGGAQ